MLPAHASRKTREACMQVTQQNLFCQEISSVVVSSHLGFVRGTDRKITGTMRSMEGNKPTMPSRVTSGRGMTLTAL
jgi:hypothetical protein